MMKLLSCCNASSSSSSLISLFDAIILIFLLNTTSTTTLAFVGTSSVNNRAHQTRNNNAKNTHIERKAIIISDKNNNMNLIRGEKHYNTENCPIIVAKRLGVQPTMINASAKTWKRAWKIHKRLIPILHSTDSCKPSDSSLNIACMWWKSLSGNDKSSPVYDNKLAYDLLPSGWRNIIRLHKFYPRLHHGNVELRTAYLDNQISEIKNNIILKGDRTTTTMIRLVCMGAGYDTRGVKMLERSIVDQVYELDLPDVVEAKQRLFQRLLKRRPWLQKEILSMPTLIPCDFNIISDVEKKLRTFLHEQQKHDNVDNDDTINWHTIFVFEGVMIYLEDGIPSSLLNITSNVLKENNLDGSLCFADRLENISTPEDDGDSYSSGEAELMDNGWQIMDWCPKPGLAKHMGSAKLSTGTYIV
jgi:hypothetical protein